MIPDGWTKTTLAEISDVIDCKHRTPSYADTGIPLISPGNISWGKLDLDNCKCVLHDDYISLMDHCKVDLGDLVMGRNQSFGVASYVYDDRIFALGQDTILIKPKGCDSKFLYQTIQSPLFQEQINRLSSGSTFKRINLKDIRNLQVLAPKLDCQLKIAEVLGVWDESIDLLERLIGRVRSRKQGLMQQLLTGKKRFKEFEGSEWKRYHFKDIFRRITRKNTVNNSNILTISGTHGLINQRDFFNKRVAADNLDGYYLIEKGEFAYNKSYSNGYPLGAIKRLDRYDTGVLSTLYICFGLSNALNSGDFMAHYFESGIFNKEIYGIAQEGARNHGLLNIGVNDFFELFLRIPSLPEQEKIAAVLTAADEEISTLEKQLAAYKQQKLGLMQQLLTGSIRI
jgi:type I restriction enzyme, S subunit